MSGESTWLGPLLYPPAEPKQAAPTPAAPPCFFLPGSSPAVGCSNKGHRSLGFYTAIKDNVRHKECGHCPALGEQERGRGGMCFLPPLQAERPGAAGGGGQWTRAQARCHGRRQWGQDHTQSLFTPPSQAIPNSNGCLWAECALTLPGNRLHQGGQRWLQWEPFQSQQGASPGSIQLGRLLSWHGGAEPWKSPPPKKAFLAQHFRNTTQLCLLFRL